MAWSGENLRSIDRIGSGEMQPQKELKSLQLDLQLDFLKEEE